jgi:uncharacterized iron-regulated membrane protein
MRLIDLAHRWLGGLVGLILAVLGLSGAVLAHKDAWVNVPGAHALAQQSTAAIAGRVEALMADPQNRPRSIVFAAGDFGLDRLSYAGEDGAYADQAGRIVARWDSRWARPEVWLFDLHHHLFTGDGGEMVVGAAGLCGLGFVITGLILWWPLRRGFEFRLWPRRLVRHAVLRQHRDFGVFIAPLLALSLFTGAVMVFRPVAGLVLGPGISAEVQARLKTPRTDGRDLAAHPDWRGMVTQARRLYPDAEVRILSLPRKPGDPISIRLRQPAEWLPNGRTAVWFAPDTSQVIGTRDALTLPPRVQAYNAIYPLHAGKVGGLGWRLAVTASGLSLTLLGGFTTWTFWFQRNRRPRRSAGLTAAALQD